MSFEPKLPKGHIRLGQISGLHGVQGWIKVFSDTQPRENIFSYSPWLLNKNSGSEENFSQVEVLHWRKQGKTLVAKLKGLDDREQARSLIGAVVSVDQERFPQLDQDEYYWHQLVGLKVVSQYNGNIKDLGQVAELIETGSNDVLVVRSENKEYLVPWVFGQFILNVDLEDGSIKVDWDPDF